MTNENKKELIEAAQQLPVEAVRQFEDTIKRFFESDGIPYNKDTLSACVTMAQLIHAGLPPIYATFSASSVLLLMRLIDEQNTGFVASPVKP